ncbi:MAG: hypothetical protein WA364_27385 [Candidatus Nitrosopolaris sp.]
MLYARRAKIASLTNDVTCCINPPNIRGKRLGPAPFPALLFCFSVIDRLGALSSGKASKESETTTNSKLYMKTYMKYVDSANKDNPEWKIKVLLDVYRHKLVHLAGPRPVTFYEGKVMGWRIAHAQRKNHLKLVPPKDRNYKIMDIYDVKIDTVFVISITQMVTDIKNSVFAKGGYMSHLKNEKRLRINIVNAINQICDPVT